MPEIELDLKTRCIETAAKRSYNRLLSEYFRTKGADRDTEKKLALLQKALSTFDFPYLRSTYKELAGNSDARIVLADTEDHLPGIIIDGRPIDAKIAPTSE